MVTCDKIEVVEQLASGDSVLKVILSDGRAPMWIYQQAKALEFLNKEVIVVTRKDIYKGEMQDFIATITIPTIVNVLPKEESLKLYLDVEDNQSNVTFSEIAVGETRYSSIVYCTSCEFESSAKAAWQKLVIRDKTMHTATLRVFDYSNESADFTGQYVLVALTRTHYGFQTNMISHMQGEIAPNPEIDLAKNYITEFFSSDDTAQSYLAYTALIDKMTAIVDYEPGYGLMRMAMELELIDSMRNVTKDIDLETMAEAVMCSYGYLTKQSALSSVVNNIVLAMNFRWKDKSLLLRLLDILESDKEEPAEAKVLKSVRNTVNTLLEVRKGVKT